MTKTKIPLLIGIVLAVLAAFIAYYTVNREKERYANEWELGQILVAATNIKAGQKLTSDMLEVGTLPKKYIREGMLKPNRRGFLINQPIITDIRAGDPLFDYDIEQVNVTEGLSKMIDPGNRAISLKAGSAVGHWIRPNDHIDIIGLFKDPNTRQDIAMTIMENVTVLATGQYTGDNFKSATKDNTGQLSYSELIIYATPAEAEIMLLAETLGNLRYSLRNSEDLSSTEGKGEKVSIDTIFTGDRMLEERKLRTRRKKTIQILGPGGK